jgi:hypothetical protein
MFSRVYGQDVSWFPRDFEPRPDDLLVFFHPQRTAGMSLRRALIEVYGEAAVMSPKTAPDYQHWNKLDEPGLAPYRVYCGHENYVEKALARRMLPIGMVRDPVERLVSLYRYLRGRENHRLHRLARECDIEIFYRRAVDVMPRYVLDLQTRRLSGGTDAARAIELMRTRYLGVGTGEFMNEFVAELARSLRWPPGIAAPHRNKAQTPLDFEVTEGFREWVREFNAADSRVYQFVVAAWRGQGSSAPAD